MLTRYARLADASLREACTYALPDSDSDGTGGSSDEEPEAAQRTRFFSIAEGDSDAEGDPAFWGLVRDSSDEDDHSRTLEAIYSSNAWHIPFVAETRSDLGDTMPTYGTSTLIESPRCSTMNRASSASTFAPIDAARTPERTPRWALETDDEPDDSLATSSRGSLAGDTDPEDTTLERRRGSTAKLGEQSSFQARGAPLKQYGGTADDEHAACESDEAAHEKLPQRAIQDALAAKISALETEAHDLRALVRRFQPGLERGLAPVTRCVRALRAELVACGVVDGANYVDGRSSWKAICAMPGTAPVLESGGA